MPREAFWSNTSTENAAPSNLKVNFEFVASCPLNRPFGRQSANE
jgi:hypothetical protein